MREALGRFALSFEGPCCEARSPKGKLRYAWLVKPNIFDFHHHYTPDPHDSSFAGRRRTFCPRRAHW